MIAEIKCPAYKAFPVGVEGGKSDPCKPAANFQLSSVSDHACSIKCKVGYKQKGGTGVSTLQCKNDGTLTGALVCTGTPPRGSIRTKVFFLSHRDRSIIHSRPCSQRSSAQRTRHSPLAWRAVPLTRVRLPRVSSCPRLRCRRAASRVRLVMSRREVAVRRRCSVPKMES